MPNFKKIAQMINANLKERYVIVEKGEPAWVVLNMADYEDLILKNQKAKNKTQESEIEKALTSYQDEISDPGAEEIEFSEMKKKEEKQEDPELYFEEIDNESDSVDSWDLSTEDQESSDTDGFDSIPF